MNTSKGIETLEILVRQAKQKSSRIAASIHTHDFSHASIEAENLAEFLRFVNDYANKLAGAEGGDA